MKRKLLVFLLVFSLTGLTLMNIPIVKSTFYQTGLFYPQSDSDDAMRRIVTDWYGIIQSITCGVYSSSYYQYGSGMVFRNINIPNGATISSANITFRCRSYYGGTPMNSMIRGQYVGNSSTFTTKADFDNRRNNQNTTANVYWDNVPIWYVGYYYTSPDISTVVQEIVNHVNWTSENSMCIFWDDWDDRTPHGVRNIRAGESYETDSNNCPELAVTWEIPSVFLTFYNNTGGIFRADGVTKTNGTSTEYANETILELSSLSQNASYVWLNFTWGSNNATTNPYNITLTSNSTIWCYFSVAPEGYAGFVFLFFGLVIGVVVGAVIGFGSKKR